MRADIPQGHIRLVVGVLELCMALEPVPLQVPRPVSVPHTVRELVQVPQQAPPSQCTTGKLNKRKH